MRRAVPLAGRAKDARALLALMATKSTVHRTAIRGVHPQLQSMTITRPESRAHREAIAQSMRVKGWDGLPLLVHEAGRETFQAWNGMHRLLAAGDAGVDQIPVVIMTRTELYRVGFTDAEIDHEPWIHRARLVHLPDQEPRSLMNAEEVNQPKRGW